MIFKKIIYFLLVAFFVFTVSCKAKKCPNFEGDGAKHHVKYDRNGLVKKKGTAPQRSWDSN